MSLVSIHLRLFLRKKRVVSWVILQLNFFPSEVFIVPGDELEEGILVYGRFSITNTFFRKIPLTPPRRCLSPFFDSSC